MRVVVTGGTGFIGANVVRHLLARGDSVRCLVRASSPTLGLDELEVERVPTSLTDPERLIRHLDGFEGLYHLAGTFDAGPSGMRRMYRVHVEATRALLRAGAAHVTLAVLAKAEPPKAYAEPDEG